MLPAAEHDAVDDKRRRGRRRRLPVARLICLALAAISFMCAAWWWSASPPEAAERPRYDCNIIPGGGLDASGAPTAWVAARLDTALRHDTETDMYLVLSRGTTHKPAPTDGHGFAIDEAAASARYLVEHGVAPSRVLLESWVLRYERSNSK